ncbi:MAG: Biosynthetic arginine decarboxylase [uncultured Thermomicrobiales bacterium]|uniref:Biosynthetic arginine decarboxylase n=1 Tax=uncultured Thermomicrobiales bacterium TaxID=1645740 RepID=A0A6J4VY95_9BACT|nr:MAG: Biosynthetic arginine decarboxylase [uncultured Thermomicrobiales bacterium]
MTPQETPANTYLDWLRARYPAHVRDDGHLNDFLSVRANRLHFRDLDLYATVREYGSPLELVYTPLITERVSRMIAIFDEARAATDYRGEFIYANATKANVAEEVIRHALLGGAHYETSSSYDIDIARLLWRRGILPGERLLINNGFKIASYAENIKALRREGYRNILPVFDGPEEIAAFADFELPLAVGLRQRIDHGVTTLAQLDSVESRFGMGFAELSAQAERIAALPTLTLKLYHAMLGSQLDDEERFVESLLFAVECYCTLKEVHPTLEYFDFGGGVPVPYSLDFDFDYAHFARLLLAGVRGVCARRGVPEPTIVGEFGRYTTAEHGAHLFRVIEEKPTAQGDAHWYIVDSSLMVALPDSWGIGQKFIVLPLNGYDRPPSQVWLGGLTCDSDDVYREGGTPGYLTLPQLRPDEPLYLGFFGTGAYQEMLSGVHGVHHCLLPEAKELIIEHDPGSGSETRRVVQGQSSAAVLAMLGYDRYLTDDSQASTAEKRSTSR